MNFPLLKHSKQGENKPLHVFNLPLSLVTIVPFALHIFATICLVEFFFIPRVDRITQNTDRSLTEVNDRVFSRLDNYLDDSSSRSPASDPTSVQGLNSFLQQLESDIPELTEVTIKERNNSIVTKLSDRQRSQANFPPGYSQIARQRTVRQLSSGNNSRDWLVTVTTQKPISSVIQDRNRIRLMYLGYLLPITFLGIAAYIWLERYLKNSVVETASDRDSTVEDRHSEGDLEATSDRSIKLSRLLKEIQPNQQPTNYVKSSLVADMSHELRSPLNAILGFAQIMQQEPILVRSQQENLVIIKSSGERLLSIINELVDLSKIEVERLSLEERDFDFYRWLDKLEHSLKFPSRQGLEFSLTKDSNLPRYINLDESRLRQILQNLIEYCSKPCPSQIKLKVFASLTPSDDITFPERYNLSFEVENSSLSISTEELAGLFNPSVRAKQQWQSSQSSSLSLPISRQLAQLMGGDITVISDCPEKQQGIAFQVIVRARAANSRDLPIESIPRRVISLESEQPDYRILVVDDSKTNRKIMVQLLERVGFQVREAVNGKEAIEVWLDWHPDMIWMDLRMPIMNGYEATEQIKSRSPTLSPPIVALTASTLEEERSHFSASKYDDFVGKPFSENIIFDKIAQHLGVRYTYETIVQPKIERFQFECDSLKIMSLQWLTQAEQAAASLDADLLTTLLQQIPSEHSGLKQALQKQVDNFDFEQIINSIEQSKSEYTK